MKQRASTMLRQRTLFVDVFFAVCQVMLASLSSSSTDLLQVFTGLPTFTEFLRTVFTFKTRKKNQVSLAISNFVIYTKPNLTLTPTFSWLQCTPHRAYHWARYKLIIKHKKTNRALTIGTRDLTISYCKNNNDLSLRNKS